jgi:hypothetical protein
MLTGDHILTVRRAVAEAVPPHQPRLKARILAGTFDECPLMAAGIAAAERVLEGLFS